MKDELSSSQEVLHSRTCLIIPSATVFISSFCIMVLELVAARLIAKHLGSSLYTWTAVIGVVLAGITLGNYLGGRIADRFVPKKALAVLFALCSITCITTIMLNNLAGTWTWLWQLSWPTHIFAHISLVFLLPSVLLGTISPIVAKMALDRGLATGRTVGDIYAWGAAGSIAGTFATGYYLIATMGSMYIIWSIAAVLLLMALCYWVSIGLVQVWLVLFPVAAIIGIGPWDWARQAGAAMSLRNAPDPRIIYEDESQYFYIAVKRTSETSDTRDFIQDKLTHSRISMDDVTDLQYEYAQIHAAVTHRFAGAKDKLSVLVIGGGGYVFPRYIEKTWPGSSIDVVEIDPAVTAAATEAFGLARDTSIKTFNLDARNYVDGLINTEQSRGAKKRYDFIYEDAVNDYSVPYQLTTREFNDKLAVLLGDDGIYMMVLIEVYRSGLLLGAYVNTLEQTFNHVYVISTTNLPRAARNTFVIIACQKELDLTNLAAQYSTRYLDQWHLSKSEIAQLKEKTNNLILTDDYAPVENLLVPIVHQQLTNFLVDQALELTESLIRQNRFAQIIKESKDLLRHDDIARIIAFSKIGKILATHKRPVLAIEAFQIALGTAQKAELQGEICVEIIHSRLGRLFMETGQDHQAQEQFTLAQKGLRQALQLYPDSAWARAELGDILAMKGKSPAAAKLFAQAITLNPTDKVTRMKLALSLELQGRIDEAIAVLSELPAQKTYPNQPDTTLEFNKYIEHLEQKNDPTINP